MRPLLLLVLFLYVLIRVVVVVLLGDVFFYGEELEKGLVGKALAEGIDVPYAKLPFHPYEGGGFVASHVKLNTFFVFGENVLAHKIAAIGWGVLLVVASVGLAMRHVGRGAAVLMGLFLVAGPAHFQNQSLVHLGIHYEALLFIALVFDLGLRVASTPATQRVPPRVLIGLGLASGFGTYFSYQVPIAVLAVIVLLARTNWRRIFAPALVVATLVGLLPLMLMALAVGGDVVDIHGSEVGGGGGWARMTGALGVGLGGGLARAEVLLGATAIVFGLLANPPRGERARAILLAGGFAILWTIFAGASGMIPAMGPSPHWVRFIRFAPLVFALLLLVALIAGPALDRQAREGRYRSSVVARLAAEGIFVLGAVLPLGALLETGDLRDARANVALLARTSGVEIRGALIKIAPRLEDPEDADPARRAAMSVAPFAELEDPRTSFLAAELAAAAAQDAGGVTPDEMLDALEAALGTRFTRDELAVGIGAVVHRSIGGQNALRGALMDPTFDPLLAEALGRYGTGFLSLEPFVPSELAAAAGTSHGPAFLRGLGRRIFRCSVMQAYWGPELRLNYARARAHVETVVRVGGADEAAAAAVLEGFDEAARDLGVVRSTLPR